VNGRGCPVCSNRKVVKGINDLATMSPMLAKEWNFAKNVEDISKISTGSPKSVWWICEKGHEWKSTVNARSRGSSCPYCGGRFAIKDETDLATLYPQLAKSIHPNKNLDVDFSKVKPGSQQKIWWLCDKGHEWEASVVNRVKGRGCPICANKVVVKGINDLDSLNPDLAKEWNFKKNSIKPDEVSIKSNKKIWWICAEGHDWKTTINHRSNGTGCPICSGKKVLTGFNDLEFKYPIVTKFWDYEKNAFSPKAVTAGSNKYVYWLCSEGHSIYTKIDNAVRKGLRCPFCKKRQFLDHKDLTIG
jgi:DNA-directed RNA polymerase subunit RPC12/RpoP